VPRDALAGGAGPVGRGKSVLGRGAVPVASPARREGGPVKAPNMSWNSFVTADGAEIGRAQVMQAAAAGVGRSRT